MIKAACHVAVMLERYHGGMVEKVALRVTSCPFIHRVIHLSIHTCGSFFCLKTSASVLLGFFHCRGVNPSQHAVIGCQQLKCGMV